MRAHLFLPCLFLAIVLAFLGTVIRAADPKDCEVCISVLEKIDAGMDAKTKKDKLKVEDAIEAYCNKKDLENKEKKLCYFMKPIKRDVSQPFSTGMPKAKVCERLKKKSAEICTIKYPVKVDSQTDYSKLRVKELKAILAERGVECTGCLEKVDFVKKAEETAHMEL